MIMCGGCALKQPGTFNKQATQQKSDCPRKNPLQGIKQRRPQGKRGERRGVARGKEAIFTINTHETCTHVRRRRLQQKSRLAYQWLHEDVGEPQMSMPRWGHSGCQGTEDRFASRGSTL